MSRSAGQPETGGSRSGRAAPSVAVVLAPDRRWCTVRAGRSVSGGRVQLPVGSYRIGRSRSADIVVPGRFVSSEQAVLDVHPDYAVLRRPRVVRADGGDVEGQLPAGGAPGQDMWVRSGGGVAARLPVGQIMPLGAGEVLSVQLVCGPAEPRRDGGPLMMAGGCPVLVVWVSPVAAWSGERLPEAEGSRTGEVIDPWRSHPGYPLVALAALPILAGTGEVALRVEAVAVLWEYWTGKARSTGTVANVIGQFRTQLRLGAEVGRVGVGEVVAMCMARGLLAIGDAEFLFGGPAGVADLLEAVPEPVGGGPA